MCAQLIAKQINRNLVVLIPLNIKNIQRKDIKSKKIFNAKYQIYHLDIVKNKRSSYNFIAGY